MKNSTQEIFKYLINQIEILKKQNEQLSKEILEIKEENALKNEEMNNNIKQQNIKINNYEEKMRILEERIKTLEKLNGEEKVFKNKNKFDIKNIKKDAAKYSLINKFTDLGKIKDPKEIEKTLFHRDENIIFAKLRTKLEKRGIKRIHENLELKLSDE